MHPVYRRPYFRQLFRTGAEPAAAIRYPYPARLFRQYDIFPLFVLDGGAFFYTVEHLGTAGGADFIEAFESGKLLEPWMVDGKLQWDKAYDDSFAPDRRWKAEQHVWLNRLYFLLPLAQTAFRTGRKKWVRVWLRYFKGWIRAHPRPEGAPWRGDCKYLWRDMQVTWRLLVLIHSVFLLSRSAALSRQGWRAVYDAILEHADHVYDEAVRDFRDDRPGNHFLQKGSALILTAAFFPEFPRAEQYMKLGRSIVREQMQTEIYRDGGSIEASPSYSHFIARLYLDPYLTLEANGYPRIRGLEACIQRQYAFTRETASPRGNTLQIGDSYHMDTRQDLEIVSKLLPLPAVEPGDSRAFQDSCFAVLRSGRLAAYLDGMPLGAWHCHFGKPNLLLYYDGRPVIVDSGCCNYDLREHRDWFATAPAHNVVLVEPTRGKLTVTRQRPPTFSLGRFKASAERSEVTVKHSFRSPEFSYTWSRTLVLRDGRFTLHDRVRCSGHARCTLVFHFPPSRIRALDGGRRIVVSTDDWRLTMRDESGAGQVAIKRSKKPALDEANLPYQARVLSVSRTGRTVEFKYACDLA